MVLFQFHGGHATTRRHHRVHGETRQTPSPDLATTRAAREALLRQQAAQAALLKDKQTAQRAAQTQVVQDTARTRALTTISAQDAAVLRQTEHDMAAIESDIAALERQQAVLKDGIARRTAAIQRMLPLAQRLSSAPATSVISTSANPEDAVDGLAFLSGYARLTARSIAALHAQQAEQIANQNALNEKRKVLDTLRSRQASERDRAQANAHAAAVTEQHDRNTAAQARKAVAAAAAGASSLQDAIARIEQTEKEEMARLDAQARALKARNDHAAASSARQQARAMEASAGPGVVSRSGGHAPVPGTVAVAWGQSTQTGPATSMTYTTPGNAAVRAPCSGRIDYAGAFRSYGQMVILDCGRHYRFVLSGFGTLEASSADPVRKNTVLGTMPDAGGQLMVQLRHGDQTVDPRPFF
ncbi:murein hydrolase activator EnvC family protein [Brytella acorum]|uniref:Peptidoglycan DD-metalloendopeptidase family protein n=1 Tax=Brytella acorum TaxID=2959299 RepID=A0AA35V881_9PROT|nr:peptidoglycan DD-metalloendopeptidase family protein [Brytella acorum]MDF3623456.1 peptidoglycan DD-metalloendopeptidase family protein [Brytella acorum]CAI9121412.1 peptidoglycan DD-metalloendopeptidase family protein [Brytella acorum]